MLIATYKIGKFHSFL